MNSSLVKICLSCEAEYISTVERCPTCGGELVARSVDAADEETYLPASRRGGQVPRLAEGEPAIRLAAYRLDWATGLAVELAADGIAYRLEPREEEPEAVEVEAGEGVDAFGLPKAKKAATDSPDQVYWVLVHPQDQQRALAALARFQSQEAPEQPTEGEEELTECPACFGPLVTFDLGKRCPECELEFHELPEEE